MIPQIIIGLAVTNYLNYIENIGLYFTKPGNFKGIFIKNIFTRKVLLLCIQYIYI